MKKLYAKRFALCLMFCAFYQMKAQTPTQVRQITQEYNQTRLSGLVRTLTEVNQQEKEYANQQALLRGIPKELTLEEGGYAELQRVLPDGTPIYYRTYNANAAISTRANHLHEGGTLGLNLMGQDMIAHVWDGGHGRASHQEYDGSGGNNRLTIMDIASEGGLQLRYHAAHVTGTIMASGVQPEAKGMAPYSQVHGYRWNNDIAEAADAASNGMLLSNHSYGLLGGGIPDQYFGAYRQESRDWDEIMYNAPYYLMVAAAGNEGNINTYNGAPLQGNAAYDKLTGKAIAKNNLVVANAQDANIAPDGTLVSVSINTSSSEGPTDDFRIKPDITGNGTNVYSTYESSDTAYNAITGTSMASPNVLGSLLLVQEHYNTIHNSFAKAATIKGLALHTADDVGTNGPDAIFGWGLLNTKRAAETISGNGSASIIDELTLSQGQSYQIQVDATGGPLQASISWTDAPGTPRTATNDATPVLINDLDIRITQDTDTFLPWRLTGVATNAKEDNNVDPFERVDIDSASGTYTITVTHKGDLFSGNQNFTLVVTGMGTATPPPPQDCIAEVLSLPYSEGFNNTLGQWTQGSGDNFDWALRSGTTPSSGTGPSEASEGSHYIYMETSTPNNPYKTAILNAPCFDLSNVTDAMMTFNYQMTGNAVGAIHVEASTNSGLTWTSIWSQSGDQGIDWKSATVDLSTYIGSTVQLRLYGVSGSSWQGDIAIDNFQLFEGTFVDILPPSSPLNLNATNITETSLDLNWTPSTDNVSVTGYDIYIDGAFYVSVSSPSASVSGLTLDTVYDFSVQAKDEAGNLSIFSDVLSVRTAGGATTTTQLLGSYFETGLDGWLDGGGDCYRYSGAFASEGSYAMRLRDNSGTRSAMTTASEYDLTPYENVEITFMFYPNSMENGEDFWVRYTNGSGWQTIASYARGTDFNNGSFYEVTIQLDNTTYDFTTNCKFRIQCDASGNGDQVYIDEVVITGISGTASYANDTTIVDIGTSSMSVFGDTTISSNVNSELGFELTPNPAKTTTLIRSEIDIEDEPVDVSMTIYDVQGRVVFERLYPKTTDEQFTEQLEVSNFKSGVYFIKLSTSNGMLETYKLIKE